MTLELVEEMDEEPWLDERVCRFQVLFVYVIGLDRVWRLGITLSMCLFCFGIAAAAEGATVGGEAWVVVLYDWLS